jgi:predicted ester cyclase
MQAFDEVFADNYVNHNMPVVGVPGTKAGFRQVVEATRHAFPDVHVQIQDMVSEGDFVVFHDTTQATSQGDLLGIPPTGKQVAWTEIHFLRIVDNHIVEHWNNFDQLGILRQLGAIPSA